jgi:hypothetical protein
MHCSRDSLYLKTPCPSLLSHELTPLPPSLLRKEGGNHCLSGSYSLSTNEKKGKIIAIRLVIILCVLCVLCAILCELCG